MTRDEIIESALQCGVWIPMASGPEREQTIDRLQRFVGRAVAAEREACAKVCESHAADAWDHEGGALACADRIRARGES